MDLPFAESLLEGWTRRAARRDPVLPLASLELSRVRSVLLVLTTGLGDAVLSTPVFAALRRALPQARLALFVRAAWAPLFAAETDLDAVIPYHGKWRRFGATLRALRAQAPELALVLHGNDPDALPLAYLAGARHILRIPTAGTRYDWLLSNALREADRATVPGWHYIDNRLRILDSLGIAAVRHSPVIRSSLAARERVAAWRQRRLGDAAYWVLHPWAADRYKTWPAAQVAEFLAAASQRWPGMRIVITGSGRERAAAEALAAGRAGVVVAAGELAIAETAALLAEARAVVAPDTGLLHLAAALDVPCVGLYAPTRTELVGPRAATAMVRALQQPLTCEPCLEKRCPYANAKCMEQFGAGEVVAALAEVMAG
jgi:ADP-heptose:LPS heptosyltransferase